jgi:hypothetical protein
MMTSTDKSSWGNEHQRQRAGPVLQQFSRRLQLAVSQSRRRRRSRQDQSSIRITNSTKLGGPKPQWVILNEISTSVWQDTTQKGIDYRNWVVDCLTRLHDVHGFTNITYSPFATVGTVRAADWQRVAAKSYIGIENYLSGAEVMAGGSDYASRVAWAQAQYQASKTTYMAAGVTFDRLFLGEHFANTIAGTGWGRSGIAASDWDTVLQIRQDALRNVGFPGFLAYNWGGNGMAITTAEQLQHEYWYRTRLVLPGQQPQWLSDSSINVNGTVIPLSWSEQLNWIGGVPNAIGSVANFYKTITTSRSITLDGNKTIGAMSFNSSFTYTIAPGTAGALTINNANIPAPITLTSGQASVTVPLIMQDPLSVTVTPLTSNLTFSGGITNTVGDSITKLGQGTLVLSGTQSHGNGTSLAVSAGTVVLNSDLGTAATKTVAANVTGKLTMNTSQHLASLTVNNGGSATLASNGNRFLHTRGLTLTGTGKLDLANNDLIVETGSFTTIRNAVLQGFGASTGITSSTSNGSQILALFDNALVDVGEWPSGSGNTVATNAVVGKYTYFGDVNLDGQVTGDDYTIIDSNLNTAPPVGLEWLSGDANLDGIVTGDDYTTIDSNLGLGVGNPLAPNSLAVPEPAAIGILSAGLLLARRRR